MSIDELEQIVAQQDLANILTIKELRELTGLNKTTIMIAITRGTLYAEKRDAPEWQKGGVWLVSKQSALALWPDRFNRRNK